MEGPFKSALEKLFSTSTTGVCKRTLVEYRVEDGVLKKYEFTRKYFDDDYIDSNQNETFTGVSK